MAEAPRWILLDEAAVLTRLSAPELTAVRTAAKAPGQADPLLQVIESVVVDVRRAVAANPGNVLAEGQTIPASGARHALALIRGELVSRLPGLGKTLMDELRMEQLKIAERWLASKPLVEQPEVAAPALEQIASAHVEVVSRPTERVTSDSLAGL